MRHGCRKWLGHFDHLTKLLEREHKMMVMLATKMRLTHQSQYDRMAMATKARASGASFGYIDANGEPAGLRPWERHK